MGRKIHVIRPSQRIKPHIRGFILLRRLLRCISRKDTGPKLHCSQWLALSPSQPALASHTGANSSGVTSSWERERYSFGGKITLNNFTCTTSTAIAPSPTTTWVATSQTAATPKHGRQQRRHFRAASSMTEPTIVKL